MVFPVLPNELVFMIALQLSQNDLNALIKTCRMFYMVLSYTLYANDVKHKRGSGLVAAAGTGNIGAIEHFTSLGINLGVRTEDQALRLLHLRNLRPWNRRESRRETRQRNDRILLDFSTCGETALHRAAECNQEAMVKYLLDRGADMNTIDTQGYFPIQLAAHRGHTSIITTFLERGFKPNTISWATLDASVLHSAVFSGQANIVKLLLDRGANATLTKSLRWADPTPFHMTLWGLPAVSRMGPRSPTLENLETLFDKASVLRGREDCAVLLLQYGPHITSIDDNHYLIYATKQGFAKVVQMLLERGADPQVRVDRLNALGYARRLGFQEIVDLLEPITCPRAPRILGQ